MTTSEITSEANHPVTTHHAHAHSGVQQHEGGCHCGAVRFRVELDVKEPAGRCNCSVCTKIAATSRIVKPDAFTFVAGEDAVSTYVWGGAISVRFFCARCGVHCFGRGYLEDIGGEYVSVNLNCLDDVDPNEVPLIYWDGRHNNWQGGPRDQPWPIFSR